MKYYSIWPDSTTASPPKKRASFSLEFLTKEIEDDNIGRTITPSLKKANSKQSPLTHFQWLKLMIFPFGAILGYFPVANWLVVSLNLFVWWFVLRRCIMVMTIKTAFGIIGTSLQIQVSIKVTFKNLLNFGFCLSWLVAFAQENEMTKTWKSNPSLVFCSILLTHLHLRKEHVFFNP